MRVAAIVILLVLGGTARGAFARGRGHSCHRGCGLWTELGAVALRFAPGSLQPDSGARYAPGDDRAIAGIDGRLRGFLGIGGTPYYTGFEWDLGTLTSAPALVGAPIGPDALARGGAAGATVGTLYGSKAVFGAHWIGAGALSYGGEAAAGFRFATMAAAGDPPLTGAVLSWAVEARAKADWWLTPHLTIGASAAVDVIDPRDVSVALMIGAHAGPYDYMR